jgi:hypothetical protein
MITHQVETSVLEMILSVKDTTPSPLKGECGGDGSSSLYAHA